MSTVCGILGRRSRGPVESMLHALRHRDDACRTVSGDSYVVAGSCVDPSGPCLLDGIISLDTKSVLSPLQIHEAVEAVAKPQSLKFRGHFSLAVRHARERPVVAAS